jgi:lipopolysaccharide export system permease protein
MSRLNAYVLRAFLRPLFLGIGALLIMTLLADLMEKLDKFLAGRASVGAVAGYLAALIPLRLVEILPVACLLAALFALGRLSRHQEITASLGGGIHPWTLVKPIVGAGAALSLFSWAVAEGINPWAGKITTRLWDSHVRHLPGGGNDRFDNLVTVGRDGTFYLFHHLSAKDGDARGVHITATQGGRPLRQWDAEEARWDGHQWILTNGFMRQFDAKGTTIVHQREFKKLPVTPLESPRDLAPPAVDTENMNYRELNRLLRQRRFLGLPTRREEVDLQTKLAFPWANFIVLFVGIPLAFSKRGGKVRAIATATGVAFVYFGFMQVGRALGQRPWCPPIVGAWMANVVFLTVGGILFRRLRRRA